MSDPTEEERTDPSIALPERASGPPSDRAGEPPVEGTMEVVLPDAAPPPLPGREAKMARPPSQPAAKPRAPFPGSARTPSAFPPPGRTPSAFPPAGRKPSAFPSPIDPARGPMAMRPPTMPPSRMPKPSDPPPPRPATPSSARPASTPPERQRIAQMETQLDQTRSAIARQKNELDELRARLEEKEQRLDALLDRFPSDASPMAAVGADSELDRRLRELEQKKEEIARELRVRFSAQEEDTEKHIALLDTLSNRLQWLEEGEESARIRMRLESVGHRLTSLESKLVEIAESQDDLRSEASEREARDRKWDARIERLESLFEEMADELRTQRDGSEVDALRARLEGIEALVIETGTAEQALKLEVEALRGSIAPPSRAARTEASASEDRPATASTSGDDLTQIKGIGPKFARQLEGLGVTTFAQVAAWGADDIELIAAELGIKPSRITRAGWVKSAQALVG